MVYQLPIDFEAWYKTADVDYTTNAQSYYESLARNKHFMKLFTEKIIEINNGLLKDFGEFKDLTTEQLKEFNDRLDGIKEEMKDFFNQWLADGVLDKVINQDILNKKANQHWIDVSLFDSIDKAIEAMGDGNCVLFFPPGFYKITPKQQGGLLIKDKKNFTVLGWGATLYNDPLIVTNDTPSSRFIRIQNCSDFNFIGFTIDYKVSWNSKVSSGLVRDEQVFEVWAERGEKCDNFSITNNTFKFNGPSLNYYPDNITNRFSVILLASQTADGKREKLISNFNISNNSFIGCIGRVIYTLLARVGNVSNNRMMDLGKLVDPNEFYAGFAETVAFRFLVSSNITSTGNTIQGFERVQPNMNDKGNVRIFYVGHGGFPGLFSESIEFIGNTISFGTVGGWFVHLGDSKKIKIKDNNVKFMDTIYGTYGFRSEEDGIKEDIDFSGNTLINAMTMVYLNSGSLNSDYKNVSVEDNDFINGNNTLVSISDLSKVRAYFGYNYWADKKSKSFGANRVREITAYRLPPLTGDYTQGDICINSGFDIVQSPVLKWVFQYKGAVNYWRPIEFATYVNSTPPTMPTVDDEKLQFMGLQYIESTSSKLATWTGLKWVYADGTVKI